ncbi:hypothetical protein M422DRAFT_245920 [Sphaerobolus stellatus SS14]|nr:hypothetical protein M422DRAFT_245920 [Sphaerobolus stellatus SS14]
MWGKEPMGGEDDRRGGRTPRNWTPRDGGGVGFRRSGGLTSIDSHQTVSSRPRPSHLILLFPPKRARPRTSKACRKQKSRCERLPGGDDDCHRCEVIGIPCVFRPELPATDVAKKRKPRPLLPRAQAQKWAANGAHGRPPSPDKSRLHVLANTTQMLSAAAAAAAGVVLDSQDALVAAEPLLSPQVDPKTSRFRLDWQR